MKIVQTVALALGFVAMSAFAADKAPSAAAATPAATATETPAATAATPVVGKDAGVEVAKNGKKAKKECKAELKAAGNAHPSKAEVADCVAKKAGA